MPTVSGASTLNFSGLATGIDSERLITSLLSIEQRRIDVLQTANTKVIEQQTVFKGIEAKLLDLQAQVGRLSRAVNGVFDARTVTSSNETIAAATASASAAPGVYNFRVNSLARSQQTASQGFDDPNAIITQGTFQLRVGSGATTTITVDGTNNTLQGLANAINASGSEVRATIVNDGSDSRTQPYRLLLTGAKSGAANAITITNNLAASGGGAMRPELSATSIGNAVAGIANTSTSLGTANAGPGAYTGTGSNSYRITVATGGIVGTDTITLNYTDTTGANTGTITVNAADLDQFKTLAQGVQVKFGAGNLIAGDTFTIDAFAPNVQTAADASVTVGTGSGALTLNSDTNQLNGVFTGVSLNLLAADPTKDVTLTVANDTGKVKTAIEDFVNSYNDLVSYVDERDDIDPNTGTAGILLGSRPAAEILNKLSNDLASPVTALGGALNRLSAVGVRFNDKGRLELDASKLDKALNGQVPGATYADLAKLFTLSGSSSAGGVKFILGSTKTKADGAAIQVDVTQAARQANVTATNMMAGSVTITAGNNTFALNVNGRPATIVTLSAGTYTQLQLAQELQSKINADPILAGNRVSVVVEGGRLRVTTDTYGSASSITGIGGTAAADLGFTGAETGRGQDVVGKFIVNGVEETATGIGQLLGGASGNANTDGLQVLVSLTDSQVQAGPDATITVTRGAAARLDQAISSMLDPINGRLKTFDKSLQRQVDDNNKQITRVRERMDDRQQALIQQFARMEAAVSRLRSAGDTLAAQINQSTANSR